VPQVIKNHKRIFNLNLCALCGEEKTMTAQAQD